MKVQCLNFLAICTLDYKQLFFIIDQPGVSYFVNKGLFTWR